jgi:hypothetical protein
MLTGLEKGVGDVGLWGDERHLREIDEVGVNSKRSHLPGSYLWITCVTSVSTFSSMSRGTTTASSCASQQCRVGLRSQKAAGAGFGYTTWQMKLITHD